MATTSTTANQSDGWVLVDSSGADALIQCRSTGGELKVAFSTTAPITDSGTSENPIIGIDNATTTSDGAMSSQDKSKLDGIESGAQVNTVTSVAGKTGAVTLTKSDVSLGNVDNYATANQTQATTGTSTSLFMTPQGVRYFVEDGEYTIDGGTF